MKGRGGSQPGTPPRYEGPERSESWRWQRNTDSHVMRDYCNLTAYLTASDGLTARRTGLAPYAGDQQARTNTQRSIRGDYYTKKKVDVWTQPSWQYINSRAIDKHVNAHALNPCFGCGLNRLS